MGQGARVVGLHTGSISGSGRNVTTGNFLFLRQLSTDGRVLLKRNLTLVGTM